jgi:hypothetical protein
MTQQRSIGVKRTRPANTARRYQVVLAARKAAEGRRFAA